MDRSSQLMFALQSPIGLRFGATQSVEAERITFEMDVQLEKGISCPFRMELTGVEDTVMGVVRIDRVLPKRQGALPRFVAKILEMPDVDRRAFDGWRRDQATGGISRRMERDPDAIRQQMTDQMRGATDAESRVVLEKMNSKSIYKRKSKDRIEGDPFGLGNESEAGERANQDSLRNKLRASAEAMPAAPAPENAPQQDADAAAEPVNTEDLGLPTPPDASDANSAGDPEWLRPVQEAGLSNSNQTLDWLEGDGQAQQGQPDIPGIADALGTTPPATQPTPPPVASEPEAPEPEAEAPEPEAEAPEPEAEAPEPEAEAPEPEAEAPEPEAAKPLIVVDGTNRPVTISVTYLSVESFQKDYTSSLRNSALTAQHAALEMLYIPVEVTFALPDGQELVCMAQTVARTSSGTAVALELDGKQRKILAEIAGS